MPAKLDKIVKALKRRGYSESRAYAIASKRTGIKKKTGGGWTKGKRKVGK